MLQNANPYDNCGVRRSGFQLMAECLRGVWDALQRTNKVYKIIFYRCSLRAYLLHAGTQQITCIVVFELLSSTSRTFYAVRSATVL